MKDEWESELRAAGYEQAGQDVLTAELAPGESVLWRASPAPGTKPAGGLFLRVFSLFWLGFAVFWELGALRTLGRGAMGFIFPLFGLPFVGMGVWMAFVQPARAKQRLESAVYAVTTARALIVEIRPARRVRSLPLGQIQTMEKSFGAGGAGTLLFYRGGAPDGGYGGAYGRGGRPEPFAFYGVDADAAQRAVQSAAADAR